MSEAQIISLNREAPQSKKSELVLHENAANELIFAVVGHVGSGTSHVAGLLKTALEKKDLPGGAFEVVILKATEGIVEWAHQNSRSVPSQERKDLGRARDLQDLGDAMREHDHAAVARALIRKIRQTRAQKLGVVAEPKKPIIPDGKRRAYILDSLRHPAEVFLLRNLYQTAFTMIGVVCDEDARVDRLTGKFSNAGKDDARNYMKRDAKADAKHGQRVEDTFHLSDYFVDNSANRTIKSVPNPNWTLPDQLSRLIKIVTHSEVVRPNTGETAMYAASGAQRRSACLSRQVGATLVDRKGNLIAVGTNEVPCAGGGVYGQRFTEDAGPKDERCAFREDDSKRHCANTREQVRIIDELMQLVAEYVQRKDLPQDLLAEQFRRSSIGGLIEFSRAVHAEMDALLSAGREGRPTAGARMYVTTFPCHSCARHIVAAGIDEVQYVESYPKSKALTLHEDSITQEPLGWKPPSQGGTTVLFRPFTGVAPRLYARAFLKDRDLKDDKTGHFLIGDPHWGNPWDLARISYTQLEAELNEE